MSSKLIDKPLENAEVAIILSQAQKFCLVRKWEGPAPAIEEESVAAPIVNWFLDQLEDRNREAVGK